MSVIALPTIKLKGKEYFIDSRLQEIRSKVSFPEKIKFISFNDLPQKELNRILTVLYPPKKGEK